MSAAIEAAIQSTAKEAAALEPAKRAAFAHGRVAAIVEAAGGPAAVVAWASEHRVWRFNLAEVAADGCSKPPELAAAVIVSIVEELAAK